MAELLVGAEIHGFLTLKDLDVPILMEEAKSRWLRSNEIHAILCNSNYFSIYAKPVHLPKSGTVVLFDRKMLRNFRKDGHNWKKKKDGKTVNEAHEHLKVGTEERIHVYYAHGEDSTTFVRRCYWLLNKSLENIVLVHYRETHEGAPTAPPNSHYSSISDQSPPLVLSEELNAGATFWAVEEELQRKKPNDSLTVQNHERRLHELNTLEWDDLMVTNDSKCLTETKGDKVSYFDQQCHDAVNGAISNGGSFPSYDSYSEVSSGGTRSRQPTDGNFSAQLNNLGGVYIKLDVNAQRKAFGDLCSRDTLDVLASDGLQNHDSFGNWINYIMIDSPGSVDDPVQESSISSGYQQSTLPEHLFSITDVSPTWAFSNEKTKILVTGFFHEEYLHLSKSSMFCVCGDIRVPVDFVQAGVYRCWLSPHSTGLVHLYMSLDGHEPISQVLNFEYRTPQLCEPVISSDEKSKWEDFQVQMRLAHLLFSSFKGLNILSSKLPANSLEEAKRLALKTAHVSYSWAHFIKSIENNRTTFPEARDSLFELTLKTKLKEWLLERVADGSKTTEYDVHGQGVIHLCAILGHTWAVPLYSWSGLSLDFRDKNGWTALHWAAYYGREKMVAVLLSAGAKPNLVTDPTSENPGGCTAADIASRKGYDGLGVFLSEQALVGQLNDMTLAGNISGSLQTSSIVTVNTQNLSKDEVYLKDTLSAYRTAAEAAAQIQAAFREHSLIVQAKSVRFSNLEGEAQGILAALKIQHAFRNHETRKKLAAAVKIQHRFRTWKVRKEFLKMRRHAVRIQAAFRGFHIRRHCGKILWSVGVLEKAILRWRMKRKGLRGLQVDTIEIEADGDRKQESDLEEDFYRTSRKQAEERVERAVVRVQAMFRSKKAQEEYRRMKLTHDEAKLEYVRLLDPGMYMDG